jgi:hypothetical protein
MTHCRVPLWVITCGWRTRDDHGRSNPVSTIGGEPAKSPMGQKKTLATASSIYRGRASWLDRCAVEENATSRRRQIRRGDASSKVEVMGKVTAYIAWPRSA